MSRIRKAAAVAAMVGGLVFAGAGAASADSGAFGEASNSPGVLSGNVVQVPVDVDANVCGDSLDVLGALNPAFGNSCSNDSVRGVRSGHADHNDHADHHAYGHEKYGHEASFSRDNGGRDEWAPEGWHHHGYHGRGQDCC